jgi:hypothetical protein
MSNRDFWFVSNGIQVLDVLKTKSEAEEFLAKFQDDPDFEYYYLYSLFEKDLDDYPDEYEMLLEREFLG